MAFVQNKGKVRGCLALQSSDSLFACRWCSSIKFMISVVQEQTASLQDNQIGESAHPLQSWVQGQSEVGLSAVVEQLHHQLILKQFELGLQLGYLLQGNPHRGLGFQTAVGLQTLRLYDDIALLPGPDILRFLEYLVKEQSAFSQGAKLLRVASIALLEPLDRNQLDSYPHKMEEDIDNLELCLLLERMAHHNVLVAADAHPQLVDKLPVAGDGGDGQFLYA